MHIKNPTKLVHPFRLTLLVTLVVMLSMVLILRLGYLQLSQYKRYATLSLKNQMSINPIAPSRGIILDRNGVVLAENIPVYVLEVIAERVKDMDTSIQQLSKLIPSLSEDDLERFKDTRKQYRSYAPIPLKLKLSEEEVAIFASNQHLFPGFSIKARLMRSYPFKEMTAHIVGYVGRINENDLKKVDQTNYQSTNYIGKTGIERFYESILHGSVGYQQVETDVSGRTIRVLSKQSPTTGDKLFLTIDIELQKAAHQALKGKRGAIVVIDTTNGEVLALASSPSFDPNLFVNGISHKDYRALSTADDKPLFNRAVRGLYPPASTVKPFVAIAGLDRGLINPQESLFDPGFYRLPGIQHKYRDWKRQGHGLIDLKKAITVSCDTYFYKLGHKMGITLLEDYYMKFGFGQLTHIDLFEEASGIVPSPGWKKRNRGVIWYPGDTLITAIGQGFMLATPLQLANATASLAMKGKRYQPHLLAKTVSDQNKVTLTKPSEAYPVVLQDESIWPTISEAMEGVIKTRGGTGHRFGKDAAYRTAAKTGTAQVFSGNQYEKKSYEEIPERLRDHSLFIAYAPTEKPEIAVSVLLENDFVASAVARKVMDSYFRLKNESTHEIKR